MGYRTINDRILSARFKEHPINITVIQIYAPTTGATPAEIEEFYIQLQDEIDKVSKRDILITMGDFNAKVGQDNVHSGVSGRFGLGDTIRNWTRTAGEELIEFCMENELTITNTWFQQPKRRLYTWVGPGGSVRNQIDYVLVRNRWRSSVTSVKTYPGADCGSYCGSDINC